MTARRSSRFATTAVLDKDSEFFGATVDAWDKALTAGMSVSLKEVKEKAMAIDVNKTFEEPASYDLASAAKHFATTKR